jgi:hypothetical protein
MGPSSSGKSSLIYAGVIPALHHSRRFGSGEWIIHAMCPGDSRTQLGQAAPRAHRLELTPLGDDELWAAIVEPAARVGVTVDEALAVQLSADAAGESGVLPLVQETLVLLWDRVERRQLGLDAYRQMADGGRSGLEVAIERRANNVYNNELPTEATPIARRIFLRLIQFGEDRADPRRQQTAAELRASGDDPDLFDETLAVLTKNRLLTASGEAQDDKDTETLPPIQQVDVAHEALIAGWPRLQDWLSERRAAELTRRRPVGRLRGAGSRELAGRRLCQGPGHQPGSVGPGGGRQGCVGPG